MSLLTKDTTEKLIHAFVTSRVDNLNSLLYGLPQSATSKLQKILNTAARIITLTPKYAHITPVLRDLHWLPVAQRLEYKILLLTYKAVNGIAPIYLADYLQSYTPGANLRSKDSGLLIVPKTRLCTYGDRAFPIAAAKLWNSVPKQIRESNSVDQFKQRLKTLLFNKAFLD